VNQNTKEAVGDIDGDGKLDVIIAPAEAFRRGGDHDLAWYRNPGGHYDRPWVKTVIKAKANNHHTVKLSRHRRHRIDFQTGHAQLIR
jgi:hypothetical protein